MIYSLFTYQTPLYTNDIILSGIWSGDIHKTISFRFTQSKYQLKDIDKYGITYNGERELIDEQLILSQFSTNHYLRVQFKDLPYFYKLLHKRLKPHIIQQIKKQVGKCKAENNVKVWQEVLQEPILTWAKKTLTELEDEIDDNCVDNYRVAKLGNRCQMNRYKRQVEDGCCGFFDTIIKCPHDKKLYKFGFNYGH